MRDVELTVKTLPGFPPALGASLWMLEDTRRRTLDAIRGLVDGEVDPVPADQVRVTGEGPGRIALGHVVRRRIEHLLAEVLGVVV